LIEWLDLVVALEGKIDEHDDGSFTVIKVAETA
jgi:hypothetical protein